MVPPDNDNLVAMELVTVVEKLASSPNASANSFRVSRVPGAELIRAVTSPRTNAVVANCVVFVATAAVGAAGVPVKVGDVNGANPPEIKLASIVSPDWNSANPYVFDPE
jgi:hypothetical protein